MVETTFPNEVLVSNISTMTGIDTENTDESIKSLINEIETVVNSTQVQDEQNAALQQVIRSVKHETQYSMEHQHTEEILSKLVYGLYTVSETDVDEKTKESLVKSFATAINITLSNLPDVFDYHVVHDDKIVSINKLEKQ